MVLQRRPAGLPVGVPAGSVYIMQSASQHVNPDNTVDRLPALGEHFVVAGGMGVPGPDA